MQNKICSIWNSEAATILWSGLVPEKAYKNLNAILYYIRRALSACGAADCLSATRRELRIDPEKVSCDLYELEALLDNRRSCIGLTERLTELYRGGLFQGKSYERSFQEARNLELRYIEALLAELNRCADSQDGERAEKICQRVLEINPTNEEICSHLIALYLKTDRRNQALRIYDRLERLLSEELGEIP